MLSTCRICALASMAPQPAAISQRKNTQSELRETRSWQVSRLPCRRGPTLLRIDANLGCASSPALLVELLHGVLRILSYKVRDEACSEEWDAHTRRVSAIVLDGVPAVWRDRGRCRTVPTVQEGFGMHDSGVKMLNNAMHITMRVLLFHVARLLRRSAGRCRLSLCRRSRAVRLARLRLDCLTQSLGECVL